MTDTERKSRIGTLRRNIERDTAELRDLLHEAGEGPQYPDHLCGGNTVDEAAKHGARPVGLRGRDRTADGRYAAQSS